ncbi:response regulator [Chitinispirillales bacterium ANBcel5]|uniref:HDOD domain-containing protein n=1 Tax=Cellulosispirillum alkaliphilum TaxID=3039283 RepID=UPI002A52FD11|nr:response regulator [Chitinispirillales bacterium ANBcel5]
MSESILFVDDDEMVLNAIERTFLFSDYSVYTARDTDEAFKILESTDIDMVVSDIRMAPVNGYRFLKLVKERYPKIIRIVLSAYGDREMMIKTIGDGVAKLYMLKPWDNDELIDTVGHIFKMYNSLDELKLIEKIDKNQWLPPMPKVYSKILKAVEEERDMKEIASLIEHEPATSAEVLKLVNSSFYGLSIGSVHQALVYLGIRTVKDVVLFAEIFSNNGHQNSAERETLFRHIGFCNTLLHRFHLTLFNRKISEEYSTAGLLCDIGRLFILSNYPDKYKQLSSQWESEPEQMANVEKEIVGFTHEQVGAQILNWWNLPAYIVESCYVHHDPSLSKLLPPKIVALIHIADVYAWKKVEKIEFTIPKTVYDILEVGINEIECMLDEIVETICLQDKSV